MFEGLEEIDEQPIYINSGKSEAVIAYGRWKSTHQNICGDCSLMITSPFDIRDKFKATFIMQLSSNDDGIVLNKYQLKGIKSKYFNQVTMTTRLMLDRQLIITLRGSESITGSYISSDLKDTGILLFDPEFKFDTFFDM